MTVHVLLSGATGFVGRRVLGCLEEKTEVSIRALVHQQPLSLDPHGQTVARLVDLDEPDSLHQVTDGIDVLLHLGHRVTGTQAQLNRTNIAGTHALVTRAQASGVTRIVGLGTAAVYGPAFGHGAVRPDTTPSPASSTSASRLRADEIILAAGGTVVRPHLIHGPGDRWFLPRALSITQRIGWIDEGRAQHSLLHVDALARGLVALALAPGAPAPVELAAPAEPTSIRSFLERHAHSAGLNLAHKSRSLPEAIHHRAGKFDPRWVHDVRILATTSTIAGHDPNVWSLMPNRNRDS